MWLLWNGTENKVSSIMLLCYIMQTMLCNLSCVGSSVSSLGSYELSVHETRENEFKGGKCISAFCVEPFKVLLQWIQMYI